MRDIYKRDIYDIYKRDIYKSLPLQQAIFQHNKKVTHN